MAELTHLSTDAVGDYLRRLSQYRLLTAEQEVELAQEIEAGLFAEQLLAGGALPPGQDARELRTIILLGRQASDALFHANLRLVVSIARHYTRRGLDFEDLIQDGNLGLYRAVRTFDFARGFRFATHAPWHIRSAISGAVANQSRLIRLPAVDQPVCSLDSEVPDGRGGTEALAEQLWDSSAPDASAGLFHQQLKAQVRAILGTLEEREARIIAMRFGLTGGGGQSLEEVAKLHGTTREHIRQIEAAAMEKLKEPARSDVLRQYHFDRASLSGGEAA
ncbi:sigma-70 family RNA polymerase sigma factor [Pseudarthrobacter sp. ATCC 49987]|uniref:sigma-70 family RNA polymerase sigma factor n=1 Tax=Pseudarthrobacter sp. ATCC 49987 TaxID=2698204 RepID=UPI00136F49C0|nr:sigma-70 family RNA polymerase sigma factor [Pseudarthrobacter sp. ATCC 49987]